MLLKQGQMYMTDSQVIVFFNKKLYKKHLCSYQEYIYIEYSFYYRRKVGLLFLSLIKADIAVSGAP